MASFACKTLTNVRRSANHMTLFNKPIRLYYCSNFSINKCIQVSKSHDTLNKPIRLYYCSNFGYLTLCMFSIEIKESSLSDTRCCITTLWW